MEELDAEDYRAGIRNLVLTRERFSAAAGASDAQAGVNVCHVCGHMWRSEPGCSPARCPSCRSSMWNDPNLYSHTCRRCGHKWTGRVENPLRCPSCRSKLWDRDVKVYECLSCGASRDYGPGDFPSGSCPSCGSSRWVCSSLVCTCGRCGFVGRVMPSREGLCPNCKFKISPAPGSAEADQRVSTSELKLVLHLSADEDDCVLRLAEEGVPNEEARAAYRYYRGEGEFAIARDLGMSVGAVIRVTAPMRDAGLREKPAGEQ